MKVLLISGSPRKGNTEFVLRKINEAVPDSELLLLREKNICNCKGCLYCHNEVVCAVNDDMEDIREKVLEADLLVVGSPNYFDNVSGLLKNFIDRLHPFYKAESLKGKKVILIMVGGGKIEGSKEYLEKTMHGFVKYLKLDLVGEHCFKALEANDLEKDEEAIKELEEIIEKVKE